MEGIIKNKTTKRIYILTNLDINLSCSETNQDRIKEIVNGELNKFCFSLEQELKAFVIYKINKYIAESYDE